ncbi:MAG: TatD family hydrolase [Burkholderiaceae bacterium]|nr:TatD family hydrolase [Burkholderiaceae bacterium]
MLVDSHCHLDFPELSGRLDEVLAAMSSHDVGHALCVCVTLTEFDRVLEVAARDDRLSASVGVHPDYPDTVEPDVATLVRLADHPKVVAIGETGLDYYRTQGDTEWQRERFRVHIRAARQARKPLIVHTRAASADTLRLMREEGADDAGGVMHCFTEDWETARAALDLGFHISLSGIVTFRNAAALREVAARVPEDRLLVETDAPYLAPVPFRGKTNEPAFVRFVAGCLAEVRQQSPERIAEITTDNFFRLFSKLQNPLNA